jgi:hyperosmotically inducible protein
MLTTRRSRALAVAAFSLSAALAGGLAARAQQGGVAERVGEALDNTGRAIRGGVQAGVGRARTRVHTMEVQDRVYSRLHWEKSLTASALDLEVRAGGVTVLRGVVPDAASRARAVDLARTTVGVTQVVNELAVRSPTAARVPAPVTRPAPAPLP